MEPLTDLTSPWLRYFITLRCSHSLYSPCLRNNLPQNENYVFIYSLSCHSKPLRLSFSGSQKVTVFYIYPSCSFPYNESQWGKYYNSGPYDLCSLFHKIKLFSDQIWLHKVWHPWLLVNESKTCLKTFDLIWVFWRIRFSYVCNITIVWIWRFIV